MGSVTFEVPLRITVELGNSSLDAGLARQQRVVAEIDGAGPERVDIDPDYAGRKGYDAHFLGMHVPLPVLSDEQRRNAAKNSMASHGEDATVLPYHHFSLVMNRRRQLAYYTAVNIDGASSRKPERSGDRWYFDPRIAESEQIGEDLYARNALDRGHLVRRLDPAWGSAAQALKANNDTFHFTNCSPQHANFNHSGETWQGIENHLLGLAIADRKKLVIFTGPVLTEDDPLYRGVRLPTHFWKIAAFVKPDGSLSVSAYLLDQTGLIAGMERFDPDSWQVSLGEIMERTGLDFSALLTSEVPLVGQEGLERAAAALPRRKLTSLSQISV